MFNLKSTISIRTSRWLSALLFVGLFTAAPIAAPELLPRSEAVPIGTGSCLQDVGNTTGVTVTQIGNDCIVTFTSRDATTWRAPAGVANVRYLVVGGGGSGDRGNCGVYWGRGGGGGQVRVGTLNVTSGTNYAVSVGKGGDARVASCPEVGGNNGSASQFANITASPGLGGQGNTANGGASGSGFAGGVGSASALGAGGGGGAGGAGSNKNGGAGVDSDISGTTVMYGSGGAGRDNNGAGSASSGGASGNTAAIANRGGGGADYASGWHAGADGVVILRYTFITFPTPAYNPTTLSIGSGVGGRSDTFTASGGTGALRFSLSPVRAGFSIDTSTANGAALVVSSLVSTGTYLETITVTDTSGFTVNHVVTVTVAAPVKWAVDNPTSLTTTYGTAASSRLNITGGTTGRVVTLTRPTTVPLGGITIDTSTAISSNFVTLNVSTRVLPGTYSLTVSVIDSTRVRSNQIFTVIVNRLPSLSFTNGTAETTTVVRSGLHLQYEIGQSYTGSGTTVVDLSGNNRNGLITSGIPYSSTLGGGSVAVNATRYLQVQPGVITNSDSISRFYWIYPRSATQTLLTVCNSNCAYIESELELFNSRLFARVWDLTSVSTQETLTLNTWHYVGYIYEGDTKRTSIYINGQLSASAVSTGTRGAPSGDQFELMGYNTNTRMQTNLQGDYSLGSVHYYKRVLTESEIFSNYAATAPRFLGTAFPGLSTSGNATITTTQGVASSHSLFTATEGTGGKTITLSSATAGVTLDTSTANSAILNIANTVTATNATTQRVVSTSVVATDSVTATTTYPLTLRINPPISISAEIPLTLTTTFGRTSYDTFTATQGTGNKTFTGVSSAFPSAFVLSSPSTNVALLTVSNTLPVGTYLETVTATDSVGATTSYVLTVVVNPAPTIAGATGNTVTTTLSRSASLRINVNGGTGARTISWTSPHAGITIDSSTITSQNFITLNVSANVPVRTYSFAISATDSLSARVSDTFTVIVNRWPVIGPQTSANPNLRLNLDAGNPSSYSGSGTGWSDLSGNNRNATWQTSPTYTPDFGGAFSVVGATNQFATTPNLGASDVFTVETWVRFNSLNTAGSPAGTGYPCVVTDDFLLSVINYSICFTGNNEIKGGYWRTNRWVYTPGFTPVVGTWYHFVYTVSKNGADYISALYQNGNLVGSTTDQMIPGNSGGSAYIGKRWGGFTEYINGLIPIVRVYNQALTRAEVLQNYNAQGSRFVTTNSGSETLTVTQGVAGSLTGVSASDGTGIKTFALSGTGSGISLSNPASNTFTLSLPDTLTATSTTVPRTITETVTATDAAGATTSRVYTVIVNPPVIETATSTSIATTSGVETTTVIFATQGTGNKTFALSGATSGFTLTGGVNQATLRVLSTANPGTYNLTVTATDSLGATASLPITVVVSPPPTLLGISRIESTRGLAFTSPVISMSGGTGSLSMTISNSPANSNITLTGLTSSGGSILVGSNSETGTYLSTIRVTDQRGSFSEIVVTVVVNAPVTLSGSLSITKTYGTSVTSGYSTNGTGTAPFSFSATPICAVVRTVSGSVTYERINGTDSCTWTAPVGVSTIDALIVGGGGGGGGDGGSGGGGGSINTLTSVALPANRSLSVQVGAGGTGGVWGTPNSTAGGTTSLTSGSTVYTAPGGTGGGGCGSAAVAGGSLGSGGSAQVGGSSGFGAAGTGCGNGNGSAGSSGPVSNFTGSNVTYGGGGGGGPLPPGTASVGPTAGGNGGGGAGAVSRNFPSLGLTQYFRAKPANATNSDVFVTGTCADPVTGNINYRADSYFPCSIKDSFQGYATGFFIAPVSGSITFYLTSDDASRLVINVNGVNNTLDLTPCCKTVSATWSGFVAGQAYSVDAFFTEDFGGATWILEYEYTGFTRNIIPISQFRSTAEGLAQYFRTTSLESASTKPTFTTSSLTCMERVGNINYTADDQFPCGANENFQGYATGFFIAPTTGSITFTLTSDDSSYLSININGVNNELSRPCCGEASATWSGFVKGQYYPINVYFTEIGGLATWKLEYQFTGQSRTAIPVTYLRSTAAFTLPVQGTNGLGGGGGGGSAGVYKLNGASGGSGTAILRYLTPSETATQTMITAIVNQQSPTGLLTLNVPEFVNVGTYRETITVQDAVNSPPYQAVVTITINKATPTLSLSLPGAVTTAKYGNPVTITATSPVPGTVAFVNGSTNITACTAVATTAGLATCSWTPTVVGSTTLRATLTPTDTANYNSSAQVNLPITVAKADTLTVTVASLTRQYTGSAVSVTGAFTTTGLVAIDSLTAISMLYSGTANTGVFRSATTAPTDAGVYTIAPNFPANANAYTFATGSLGTTSAVSNYESVTVVAGTLTINRAPQVLSFTYPNSNTATYSPTGTITPTAITRLDSASRTFSSSTLTKCTIDSATAVISIVEAGSCQVAMATAQTFNYLADTATATVTINKASRTFSLTPAVATLKYSESTTVTATLSGGAQDGTISYTLGSPAGCTFDPLSGELVAISGTIQCPLSATISEGINYLAESATAISLTIARANAPIITIDTVTALSHIPSTRAAISPTFTVSGLKYSDTASSLTFTYSFISNPFETFTYSDTRTPIDAGTYRITPSALTLSTGLMSNYETPTYSSSAITFTINRINQESVTIVTTNGEVEVPFTLQASGGSTTGAVTFTKLSGDNCSVTANLLTATASGRCILSVTRAGNRNYLPFTSESITVMVRNFVIFQITAPSNPTTGITIAPTTPLTKGENACTTGCVPRLISADIYDVAEGDLILLTGTNLLTVTKVYFNIYIEAPNFSANSDTQLAVRVPADLPQGDATIEVISPGGTSNRLFDFIILP